MIRVRCGEACGRGRHAAGEADRVRRAAAEAVHVLRSARARVARTGVAGAAVAGAAVADAVRRRHGRVAEAGRNAVHGGHARRKRGRRPAAVVDPARPVFAGGRLHGVLATHGGGLRTVRVVAHRRGRYEHLRVVVVVHERRDRRVAGGVLGRVDRPGAERDGWPGRVLGRDCFVRGVGDDVAVVVVVDDHDGNLRRVRRVHARQREQQLPGQARDRCESDP